MIDEPVVRDAGAAAANRSRTGPPAMTSGLWYRAVLCDALVAASQLPVIREHFADALEAAGRPDDACLFVGTRAATGKKVRGDGRVAEALFFSPAAIAAVPHLIAVCGAVPSRAPDRDGSILLVGTPGDWDLLPRGAH